ncbi:MAG: response regulator transcription factor [Candidatus Promineifilaceae bacterium]|nr:response regulator transcription factor [Anaerolineaceae bacterium]
MNNLIQICVVDSFPIACEGVVKFLEPEADIVIAAQSINYENALLLCRQKSPDVLVLGMVTPDKEMLKLIHQLKQEIPEIKVLVLAAVCDKACAEATLQANADGYMLKTETQSELAMAIREVANGKIPLSRQVVERLIHSNHNEPLPKLTKRQKDILRLVAKGQTNAQIGQTLEISQNTVRYHLRQIFQCLIVCSRTEAVMKAIKHNLL